LERPDGLAELLTGLGVVDRGLVAGPAGADRAPDDAVPRLRQTAERPSQALHTWEHRVRGEPHVVEDEFGRDRRAQRHLSVDVTCGEPRGALGDEEAA